MGERARTMLERGNPFAPNARWPIIAVEAVLLVGLGLFVLLDHERAARGILQIVALVLLVTSAVGLFTEFRSGSAMRALLGGFRAGIGVTVGAIGTAGWIWDYIESRPLQLILGWGLLAYAIIHAIATVLARGKDELMNFSSLGLSLLIAALGTVLLLNDSTTNSSTLNLLGGIFVVFGLLLAGLAFYRFRSSQARPAVS